MAQNIPSYTYTAHNGGQLEGTNDPSAIHSRTFSEYGEVRQAVMGDVQKYLDNTNKSVELNPLVWFDAVDDGTTIVVFLNVRQEKDGFVGRTPSRTWKIQERNVYY
jgi:hypothetical protein